MITLCLACTAQDDSGTLPLPSGAPSPAPVTVDSPRVAHAPSKGIFWIDAPDETVADLLLSSMDSDQILAQVLLMGWSSPRPEGPVMEWLGRRGLGGVKIFGWNATDVSTLASTISAMQSASLESRPGIPLITATDQEGGWVRHIKDRTSSSAGSMAIGATDLPADAYESSLHISRELRLMGVNMNFAPVVDLYSEKDAHVIGPRAYGNDPARVSVLAQAAFQAMEDEGIMATAKHFPGHGHAVGDSHGIMPEINDSFGTIWEHDLVPYRYLSKAGIPSILVGHLAFPQIDPEGKPATLSRKLNHELIRERIGYTGVVITDDLYMGGAWKYGESHDWKLTDIILESLKAGNDMVMLSRTLDFQGETWNRLRKAFDTDPTFREGITASVRRILLMKLKYLKPPSRVPLDPDPASARNGIPDKGAAAFFDNLSARSVSWVRGEPLRKADLAGKSILVVAQDGDFLRSATDFFPGARTEQFPFEPFHQPRDEDMTRITALARKHDLVIFGLSTPAGARILANLKDMGDRVTVLSSLTPVYLDDLPWVHRAVAVYGWERVSFRFGLASLTGAYEPGGQVPLPWFPPRPERNSGTSGQGLLP